MMMWNEALPHLQLGKATQAAEPSMDSDAFGAFYERSARSLWAYLSRCSGDPALADDLMQESYVRFLCAAQPDGEIASRRYLFRIASNLLRDHWRQARTTSIEELPENFFASASTSMDASALLGPAMARMTPRDRQLLWLAHAENYTHHEIAEITGLASASIRLLLFRARRKIKHLLQPPASAARRQP